MDPPPTSAILVVSAWHDEQVDPPVRARITATSGGPDERVMRIVVSVEEACEVLRAWWAAMDRR